LLKAAFAIAATFRAGGGQNLFQGRESRPLWCQSKHSAYAGDSFGAEDLALRGILLTFSLGTTNARVLAASVMRNNTIRCSSTAAGRETIAICSVRYLPEGMMENSIGSTTNFANSAER
jgi:hypothetical protein